MTCTEAQVFIDAYIDGELDLARSLELERHLESCPACWTVCQVQKGAHDSLARPELRHAAPASLRKRVHTALAAGESRQARQTNSGNRLRWLRRPWPAAIAGVLAGATAVIFILRLPSPVDPIERELVDSHIRSLMPNHLTDVVSTDQHTVKPWFAGRVDFSPPVKDLAGEGFPLIGGRIDYIDQHSAAVMVYKRNQHVINVFVWPVSGNEDVGPRTRADQGYNMIEVVHAGMESWAISDLNQTELRQLMDLLRE